jgi:hypothetical protein
MSACRSQEVNGHFVVCWKGDRFDAETNMSHVSGFSDNITRSLHAGSIPQLHRKRFASHHRCAAEQRSGKERKLFPKPEVVPEKDIF